MIEEATMSDMNELQHALLAMLREFHSFCVANNLTYYALGGTMLGALRHGGFIPWDDDIDVGMPRKDYEKLQVLLLDNRISNRYILETPYSSDPLFCFPYCKLYDTTTTMIEKTRKKLVRGVFIDIFPLDGLGMSLHDCKKNYKPIQRKMTILDLRKVRITKERAFYKNLLLGAVQVNPFISEKKLCIQIDEYCKKRELSTVAWGGNLVGAWRFKEVMPSSLFSKPCIYHFEDTVIFGMENAEEYLSRQYGDWSTLPPLEKRVSHHDYYLDIKQSYLKK